MATVKAILGWHFLYPPTALSPEGTLRPDWSAGPIRPPAPANGKRLTQSGKLELCGNGLHACKRLFDALHYADYLSADFHSLVLCRVKLEGPFNYGHGNNGWLGVPKLCARHRTILWRIHLNKTLARKISKIQRSYCGAAITRSAADKQVVALVKAEYAKQKARTKKNKLVKKRVVKKRATR